jgi:hypothetical protein
MRGILLLPTLAILAGCVQPRTDTPTPEPTLSHGLDALRTGDHASAMGEFALLAALYPGTRTGEQARLLAASIELDPRNPQRRLDVGAAILSDAIAAASDSSDSRPLAETLYLLALDLGAQPPEPDESLPAFPGTTLASRVRALLDELEQRRHEIERLQQELKQKDQEIQKLSNELERIRKTLKH